MKTRLTLASFAVAFMPALAYAAEGGESGGILDSPIIPLMGEFIPMVIAFLIVLFILNKFAWPMIIGALDAREEKIVGSLSRAEEAKIEAEGILVEYKEKLAEAHKEAASIVDQSRKAGEAAREEIVARANEEASAIIARAHASTEAEKRAAAAELESKVAEFAVAIAGKLIGEKLDSDADSKLIDGYLSEMGSFNDN